METPSGVQEMTVINESGLYSLILSSKLPTAKAFKRWVIIYFLRRIKKMGLKELLNKYDNYFSMNGWFSFGNEELKGIPKSEGTENQNNVFSKMGKPENREERKENNTPS